MKSTTVPDAASGAEPTVLKRVYDAVTGEVPAFTRSTTEGLT